MATSEIKEASAPPSAVTPALLINIARDLVTNYRLIINARVYELAEVEVYYHGPSHPDPYVHCHPEQTKHGKWYFHRASNSSSYQYTGGTYKGLDLSLGRDGEYFGVLIRSLYSPDHKLNHGVISGPCKIVDHILSCYGVDSITDFVSNKIGVSGKVAPGSAANTEPLDAMNNHRGFHITRVAIDDSAGGSLYMGPRVGLGVTPSRGYHARTGAAVNDHLSYREAPYRVCRHYAGITKDKRKLHPLNGQAV